jgi:hypothetical protein
VTPLFIKRTPYGLAICTDFAVQAAFLFDGVPHRNPNPSKIEKVKVIFDPCLLQPNISNFYIGVGRLIGISYACQS